MQQFLFNNDKNAADKKALIITKKNNQQVLSKPQQTFNRLIKKIEKLQTELRTTTSELDGKLIFYAKHIYPLNIELAGARKQLLKKLYAIYKNKAIRLFDQRKFLKELIKSQMETYLEEEQQPDDEIKSIFKELFNKSYDAALKEEMDDYLEDIKSNMETMFEEAGFSMNFDDLHNGMTPEEIIERAKKMEEEFYRQTGEKEKALRKKTKKQLEREEKEKQVEAAKAKNVSSIYKQLAKIFHPDLEQDPDLKMQKEELMKQLTIAYENNDLPTLLRLELQWVQKEENAGNTASNEQLSIYNQILKEQVDGLEDEIAGIYEHPHTLPFKNLFRHPGS
ncbi:hypothetical protein A8C56_23260 [Niabella ginsenosidivorans]|uniref:Molecular chaperone DnaJ n=1 Tax=Niabella ginsenosidivorans TaxID=1176587 RepID=A0A1A9IAC0_9BACT|nr:hypothetical protein [Niabella ginsenosidivorans]ANH83504.1 hypothetical protein A8C56_23260 [Niabella ginsenosidivorans]